MILNFKWTDGDDSSFIYFYGITESYYSSLVGGAENRILFAEHNLSETVDTVLICYDGEIPIACAGLRRYSETDVEVKRVWVQPTYRGNKIAKHMMFLLHDKAEEQGYKRVILQTREIMEDAVKLYEYLGYSRIDNYPPYDHLEGAICMARDVK